MEREKQINKVLKKIVDDKKIILEQIRNGKPLSELKEKGIKIVSPI